MCYTIIEEVIVKMEEENKNVEENITPVEPVQAEPATPAPEPAKKKGKGGLICIVLLLLICGGFAAWYFALGGKDVLAGKKEEPKQEEKKEENENKQEKKEESKIEIFEDNDTEHEIITFDDIFNVMSQDVTKNKAYKIQNIVINNKKASLYIDYTFEYQKYDLIPDDKTRGTTNVTIKHGDTVLYTKKTYNYQPTYVITYLGIVDNNYLIVGEKTCSSINLNSNNLCNINKRESYNEISLVSYNKTEKIDKYFNNNEFFVYDLSNDDSGITVKTLLNKFGSGMWNCEETGDVQRVYKIEYSSSSKLFTEAKMKSNITFEEYCKNKDDSIF